jgi:hypothetical protein
MSENGELKIKLNFIIVVKVLDQGEWKLARTLYCIL